MKVSYKDLPPEAKRALDAYFSDWRPKGKFGFDRMPLGWLVKEVMEHNKDLQHWKGDFAAYHRWYLREAKREEGWPPKWTKKNPDSMWAILLEGPPGGPYTDFVIHDGWHRFHYYVDHYGPRTLIPVVWW